MSKTKDQVIDYLNAQPHRRLRFYISGPISGIDREVYRAHFRKGALDVRSIGHRPVNPTTMYGIFQPLFARLPYRLQLLADIFVLATCDGIYLLEGWSASKGATAEYHFAKALGMDHLHEFAMLTYAPPSRSPFRAVTDAFRAFGNSMKKVYKGI